MDMDEDEEKSQKIQMIAFTTNENTYSPNSIILNYTNNNSHYLIKKNKQLIAFSTVLPEQKKPTKIMIITLFDLSSEYEGIKDVNCYLIVIDLKKETTKDKYCEILTYIKTYCDISKKIYLLGIKKDDDENIKITEDIIDEKAKESDLDCEYIELNADNSIEISNKILEIFNYCYSNTELLSKNEDDGKSCEIY